MSIPTGPGGIPVAAEELRRGFTDAEFFPVFQGVYEAASGLLLGVEALARWRTGQGRLVQPDVFIPAAESLGLIDRLSSHIWEPALHAVASRWPADGPHQPWVSLNASPIQLRDDRWLVSLRQMAARAGLPPARIVIEITESALLVPHSVEQLTTASEDGFLVAIDDFGKGWSSLSRLSSLPLDVLKVDRDFVVDMGLSPSGNAYAIMRAVVQLGHAIGALTIAEGVERASQCADVRRLGVDAIQGFYLGKPGPLPEVPSFVPIETGSSGWVIDLPSSVRQLWRAQSEVTEE